MASNSSEPDPKVINSIVDRLKKQGLFDKFRKECLADVDTKPAYLNLRHRTEVAVARFLSTQTWHPALNKNQLRDSLRKHINESSMMSSGIDRVVEQVVNPKIYRVFKPQIDRVVCEFLGIDPDERERQLKLKDEEQRRQRMQMECNYLPGGQQQPFPPGTITPDSSYGIGSSPLIPSLLDIHVPYMPHGNEHIESPSPGSVTPQMTPASGSTVGGSTSVGGITYPPSVPYGFPAGMQFGYPAQTGVFPGMTQQGMLQYPLGYSANMPPGFVPTIPQYPMQTMATDVTVAPPQVAQPMVAAPVKVSPIVGAETKEKECKKKKKPEPLTVEELLNIPLPPKTHATAKGKDTGKAEKKEEVGRLSPVVAETKDEVKTVVKRETSTKQVEDTKTTVVAASPCSEKMEVEGQDTSSSSDISELKPKHREKLEKVKVEKIHEKVQARDVQKKVKEPSGQANKAVDVQNPLDGSSSVSDAKDIKTETVKDESEEDSKNESSQMLSDTIGTSESEDKDCREMKEEGGESKVYHFVWDDAGCVSDATVSSVHTSDLSSFDDGSDMTTRSSDDDREANATQEVTKVKETVEQETDTVSTTETGAASMVSEVPAEVATVAVPRQKPRRLISLQYNYSDSEEEESREERKARIAREIEERYLRRQQRRAELEAKRKEREEEKAVEREQRRQRKLDTTAVTQREETIKDAHEGEKEAMEKDGGGEAKPKKRDQHRTKAKLKEELREQKVKEMRMALRRQRTRNRRYTSDEFTTFFTGNKCMRSNKSYTKVTTSDEAYSPTHDITSPPTPTQDEHFAYTESHPSEGATPAPPGDQLSIPIYEVTTPLMTGLSIAKFVHMTRSKTKQLTLDTGDDAMEPGMPYSDVSSDALSFSGSSVDSKTHHSPLEGKQDQTLPHATTSTMKSHEKSTGRSDTDTPLSRVRRKSSGERQGSDIRHKPSQSSDTSSTTSSVESTKANVQRYAISDLYKPHHSRSRSSRHSSPPPPPPPPPPPLPQREPQVRPSADTDKGQEKRRAPPIDEVDFGEAAKKSLQQISFGEAERRSKAIRQRFGQPARHETRRGSSSKSPSDRVERMPVREPVVPSGGTYWSARDEKYRDSLKASSTHGSWHSTKSSSQDDDDDNSRSKGRSRSQSDWRAEESPSKSERKTKRRKKRRKMEGSSCSGSEDYSMVSREKRISQSSSGGDDLEFYPTSLSNVARSPGELQEHDDESHRTTRRREDDTSDSEDDRSASDGDTDDDKYRSDGTNEPVPAALDSSAVDTDISAAADEAVPVERDSDGDASLSQIQSTSVTEAQDLPGELQLEIWQGSSHWSLSVENAAEETTVTPSVEVLSAPEPITDVADDTTEIVTVEAASEEDSQVFYEGENVNKGQKRPSSPGSDEGSPMSGPAKRARSDSTAASIGDSIAAESQGDTASPLAHAVETSGVDDMCSSGVEPVGFHKVPHIENPPPVESEPQLSEEQSEILRSENSLSPEIEPSGVEIQQATETHDIADSDSVVGVTDTLEDPPDAGTDGHQIPVDTPQEILIVTAASEMEEKSPEGSVEKVQSPEDAMATSPLIPDRTGEKVDRSDSTDESSSPTSEKAEQRVAIPEKAMTEEVSPPLGQSPTGVVGRVLPVAASPDLDESSPELDSILLLDETPPSQLTCDVTTVVGELSRGAPKLDGFSPSPGSVSPCGEDEGEYFETEGNVETQPKRDVSPSDATSKGGVNVSEDPGTDKVVNEMQSSPSPCHDEAHDITEDVEVTSLHDETEQSPEPEEYSLVATSEAEKSESDGKDIDSKHSESRELDKCIDEKDVSINPDSSSATHDSDKETAKATCVSVLQDNSLVTSEATLADDKNTTSREEKSAEGEDAGPQVSDVESSFDEDVGETSAKCAETSDKKEESMEDTDTSTPSVSPDTKGVRATEAKREDKELREVGRRKSRRSVMELQKDADIPNTDSRKSIAMQRQRSRDWSQSTSTTPRETRGQRTVATPPQGSTREPRKLRRPSTPPPTRLRQQTGRGGGAAQQQQRSNSVGRRPSRVVTPPAKVVTPPAKVVTPPTRGRGKAGHTPMTRASRRKSEEASLPIAKRLRH